MSTEQSTSQSVNSSNPAFTSEFLLHIRSFDVVLAKSLKIAKLGNEKLQQEEYSDNVYEREAVLYMASPMAKVDICKVPEERRQQELLVLMKSLDLSLFKRTETISGSLKSLYNALPKSEQKAFSKEFAALLREVNNSVKIQRVYEKLSKNAAKLRDAKDRMENIILNATDASSEWTYSDITEMIDTISYYDVLKDQVGEWFKVTIPPKEDLIDYTVMGLNRLMAINTRTTCKYLLEMKGSCKDAIIKSIEEVRVIYLGLDRFMEQHRGKPAFDRTKQHYSMQPYKNTVDWLNATYVPSKVGLIKEYKTLDYSYQHRDIIDRLTFMVLKMVEYLKSEREGIIGHIEIIRERISITDSFDFKSPSEVWEFLELDKFLSDIDPYNNIKSQWVLPCLQSPPINALLATLIKSGYLASNKQLILKKIDTVLELLKQTRKPKVVKIR